MLYSKFCCSVSVQQPPLFQLYKIKQFSKCFSKYHHNFIFRKVCEPPPFQNPSFVQQKQPQLSLDLTGRNKTWEQQRQLQGGDGFGKRREICSLIKTHLLCSLSVRQDILQSSFSTSIAWMKKSYLLSPKAGWGKVSAPPLIIRSVCQRWVWNKSSYKSYFHIVLNSVEQNMYFYTKANWSKWLLIVFVKVVI